MNETVERAKPGRGRPRSLKVEAAILDAAHDLICGGRLGDITAEAIARNAGVSKATLYKWWPNRTHLVLDVLRMKVSESEEIPDTGDTLEDFVQAMKGFVRLYKGTAYGAILRDMMAEGMMNPEIMSIFRERFFWKRRENWHMLWRRGVERGDLDPDLDPQVGLDIIYGPSFMRLLSGSASLTENDAAIIVRATFRGLATAR